MKVFFASCVRQDSTEQAERIKCIRLYLEKIGHSPYEYIYNQDNLDDHRGFGELAESILESDVYIAEMSLPSQTLGFQMAFALSSIKPCLYLYSVDTHGRPDAPLSGHPSRLLKIVAYDQNDIGSSLRHFLDYAEKQMASKRTSFMSTREIDRYLDKESRRLGTHKAEIIRQALSQRIKDHD